MLILVLLMGLTGCAQISSGHKMTPDELSKLVVNQTTKAEMVSMFGPPQYQGFGADGKLMVSWHYVTSKTQVFSLPQTHIQMLSAIFNEQEVLEKFMITENPEAGMRMGP